MLCTPKRVKVIKKEKREVRSSQGLLPQSVGFESVSYSGIFCLSCLSPPD